MFSSRGREDGNSFFSDTLQLLNFNLRCLCGFPRESDGWKIDREEVMRTDKWGAVMYLNMPIKLLEFDKWVVQTGPHRASSLQALYKHSYVGYYVIITFFMSTLSHLMSWEPLKLWHMFCFFLFLSCRQPYLCCKQSCVHHRDMLFATDTLRL